MKKSLWIVLVLILSTQAGWTQFYRDYSDAKREEVAEAYYLAGARYRSVGETEKGREYQDLAFIIYPRLDPAGIQLRDLPSAAALISEGKARLLAAPREQLRLNAELMRSKFLQLASALLAEDTDSVLRLFDGSVYLSVVDRELSRDQLKAELDGFFASVSLGGLVPSQIYDLSSMQITPAPAGVPEAWGETYIIRINSTIDFSENVVFWEPNQQFFIHRANGRWLFFAIGQELPPPGWQPRSAPKESRAAGALPAGSAVGREIKQAFLSCFDFFLKKDTPRAIAYFAEEISLLRLNTTISRQELGSTFTGYFENSDFSGLEPQDLVAVSSIFVEATEQLGNLRKGSVYLLTAETRLDLSAQIPFWSRFQEYYFAAEDGVWKIFAIF
jgi:hypothetical protein